MSDFLLQKAPDRGRRYREPPGIWFSRELKRWMVTSPALIRQILHDDAFAAPTYDISAVTGKLGLRFEHIDRLRAWLPLATEGERHRALRESFARHLASQTSSALNALTTALGSEQKTLQTRAPRTSFCLYETWLRPVMVPALQALAGLELQSAWPLETLPRLFEIRLPLRQRREIDDLIGTIVAAQPDSLPNDTAYQRAAVLALSVNTLPSSMALTVIERVRAASGRLLSEIDWGSELLRTGLPLIEKIAIRDVTLGNRRITAGDGLRLFIEADGVSPTGDYAYSDLFFAEGPHKCVGMNFSRLAWLRVAQALSCVDRPLRVLGVTERANDYVFNFPTRCEMQFDE